MLTISHNISGPIFDEPASPKATPDFRAGNYLDLQSLLNGQLPLDRVGPHLRHAARRALSSRDPDRMAIVAQVICSELLRRGDLVRVAVEGNPETAPRYCLIRGTNRLVDLTVLGQELREVELPADPADLPPPAAPRPERETGPAEPGDSLSSLANLLGAMEDAQQLDYKGPRAGETGELLDSILRLLSKFTPQFTLHIMLFEDIPLEEKQDSVFLLGDIEERLSWMEVREPGHSVYLAGAGQLPEPIRGKDRQPGPIPEINSAVAVPLYDPLDTNEDLTQRVEVGLLFLVARETWARDTLLRLATRLSRFVTHRWQQHSEVNKRIHIDALTGLFNRGYLERQAEILLERARRNGSPLTFIFADIDNFKNINDGYDHIVGDQILKMVARRLQEELRRVDLVCRYGGEEFVLMLPDADQEASREVLQRLLNTSFTETVTFGGKLREISVTLSYGAATYPESGAESAEIMLTRADTLLLYSKDRGRNQCHFFRKDGNHLKLVPTSRPA